MRPNGDRLPSARRRTATVLTVLLALAGCATAPGPAIDRNPLERIGALPAIAVVASTDPVEPTFASLYDDAGQGFAQGAARGALAGLMVGMLPLAAASGGAALLLFVPGMLGAMAIAPAAGALIGGVITAASVPPEEKFAEIRRKAVAALAEADPSRATARSVVEDVTRFTRYRADLVEATTAAGPRDRADATAR
jgi:MFS family permease